MDIADIGYITLILALLTALFSIIISIISARTGSSRLVTITRSSVIIITVLYTAALVILISAFLTKDFSLTIVAEHASRSLSPAYTLSALYADKGGSMMLWGWLISLFTVLLAARKNEYGSRILLSALSILAAIQLFFLTMITLVANVFEKSPVPPADGFGLNPLLQNVAMLIHPPMLYISFAAISVVFAIIISALIERAPGNQWVGWVRHWALFAWCMLGMGNLIGMWWSYNELGWGGYWAWDPVENAGLMPWLLTTALVHSISLLKQRYYLLKWSLVLAILSFAFTLLIPFITHGGIESPLHGFYGSSFPPYILGVILVVLAGSFGLFFTRRKDVQKEANPSSLLSREGAFLTTNIILVLLVVIILLGTILPRIVELFGGSRIAIDRSFFDRVAGPIMLVLVFLMGICPLLGWSKTAWQSARKNFLYIFLTVLVISAGLLISGAGKWYAVVSMVCGFPLLTILSEWFRGTRARHRTQNENYLRALLVLLNNNRSRYGGFLVHIGIILMALGIVISSFYGVENTQTLDIGQSIEVDGYNLTYEELVFKQDAAKVSAVATLSVNRHGRIIKTIYPHNDFWFSHMNTFSEVSVHTTLAEDLFVSLVWTDFDQSGKSVTIMAMVNPLVIWIWLGGGFLLLGGVVAFSSRSKQSTATQI